MTGGETCSSSGILDKCARDTPDDVRSSSSRERANAVQLDPSNYSRSSDDIHQSNEYDRQRAKSGRFSEHLTDYIRECIDIMSIKALRIGRSFYDVWVVFERNAVEGEETTTTWLRGGRAISTRGGDVAGGVAFWMQFVASGRAFGDARGVVE